MVDTDWEKIVTDYMEAVESGATVVGDLVKHAVARHRADLKKAQGNWPYRFDAAKATQAIMFFQFLRHSDGEYAGKPFVPYPWQAFAVWCLFGWVRKSTGLRRFRQGFLSMGRGNGKTPFGAALLLLVFAFDSPMEARAECYTCATKKDQANLSFAQAKRYVEASPQLSSYVSVLRHNLHIESNHSKLEKLSSDGKTADGLNIHGLLRDELHAWSEHQREFLEKLNTAMGKRRQPLLIDITTAGSEQSELWRETYDFCCLVVDQNTPVESDDYFVLIYEIDDDDNELDEAVWPKANPMLEHGVVKIDYLRDLAQRATYDATKAGEMRRYHCNKFTTSSKMPITRDLWSTGDVELPDLIGRPCYAGFDWGWKDDLTALVLVFPLDWQKIEGDYKRRYAVLCDAWACSGGPRDLTREPWKSWIADGWLNVTDSEWTDTQAIYEAVSQRRKTYTIKSLAFDPSNAREFGSTCVNEFGLNTFEFSQTCRKFNEPIDSMLMALREGRLIHGGNPFLAWSAYNLVTKVDHNELKMPAKKRAQDKIDAIVALLMGWSEALFNEPAKPSVYERRGPIIG